jgi:quinol monooxygenase YgiN
VFEYLPVIIVHGRTSVEAAVRREFVDSARKSVPLTRIESGNIAYVIATDILDADAFHLFEIWDSPESLSSHSKAPHQLVRKRELQELGVSWNEIQRYAGDPFRPFQ